MAHPNGGASEGQESGGDEPAIVYLAGQDRDHRHDADRSNAARAHGDDAFVERLGPAFNPSNMLVVDLLHEFELGVWKALFTHLIRLLYAAGDGTDRLVIELDRR